MDQNPEELDISLFVEGLITADDPLYKNTEMIDLNYHSQYEPELGFRFNVVGLHNNKLKGFPCVLASILPVASFYDKDRQAPPTDAFTFTQPDMASFYASPKLKEGDEVVRGFVPNQSGMCILLDVRVYMPEQDKFVTHGFAVCPLLQTLNTDGDDDTMEYFINSGLFSLPLYGGAVPDYLVDALLQSTEPLVTMEDALANKDISLLDKGSIIVKLVD